MSRRASKNIRLLFKPEGKIFLAFSGGVDSMVLLDVLMSKRADVTLFTVDHNTPFCPTEIACCKKLADKYGIPYQVAKLPPLPEKVSKEGWWSEKRN